MHQAISNKPEIVTTGFKEAGISKVLEDYLSLTCVQWLFFAVWHTGILNFLNEILSY